MTFDWPSGLRRDDLSLLTVAILRNYGQGQSLETIATGKDGIVDKDAGERRVVIADVVRGVASPDTRCDQLPVCFAAVGDAPSQEQHASGGPENVKKALIWVNWMKIGN
jgi:hypothetical protein